jgi:hypothetical protein
LVTATPPSGLFYKAFNETLLSFSIKRNLQFSVCGFLLKKVYSPENDLRSSCTL